MLSRKHEATVLLLVSRVPMLMSDHLAHSSLLLYGVGLIVKERIVELECGVPPGLLLEFSF